MEISQEYHKLKRSLTDSKEVRDQNNLGNDVFTKCKMGPAMLAAIDLPLKIHHKQPPHAFPLRFLPKSMKKLKSI